MGRLHVYRVAAAGGAPRDVTVLAEAEGATVRGGWGFGGGRAYFSIFERESNVSVLEVGR